MALSANWHGSCTLSGMTRGTIPEGTISGRFIMTVKFNALAASLVSALFVATLFVGAAVAPATQIGLIA